jgi:hypothetical protein
VQIKETTPFNPKATTAPTKQSYTSPPKQTAAPEPQKIQPTPSTGPESREQFINALNVAKSNYQEVVTSRKELENMIQSIMSDVEWLKQNIENVREEQQQLQLVFG